MSNVKRIFSPTTEKLVRDKLCWRIFWNTPGYIPMVIIESVLEGFSEEKKDRAEADLSVFREIQTVCQVAARLQKV